MRRGGLRQRADANNEHVRQWRDRPLGSATASLDERRAGAGHHAKLHIAAIIRSPNHPEVACIRLKRALPATEGPPIYWRLDLGFPILMRVSELVFWVSA